MFGGTEMNAQNREYIELSEATIALFRCSINANNYMFYGLSSENGLEKVTLGNAIEHQGVPLDILRKYDESQDPRKIIKDMGYVTVPFRQEGSNQVESFILLNKRDGKYQSTGIGQAVFAKNFMEMKRNGSLEKDSRLIRVPAMNVAYGSVMIEGVLHLVPVTSEGQKGGEPRPANIVFSELARKSGSGEDFPN